MSQDLLAGIALVVVVVAVSRIIRRGAGVSQEAVRQKLAAGAVVVDVRTPEEFRGGAFPGAINVPLQQLGSRLSELPKDKPLVVYCAAGGRSASATAMLVQAGFGDVTNGGGLSQMPR